MFKKLLHRKAILPAKTYSTPPGECAYVVGDIHGCLIELKLLLDEIEIRAKAYHPNLNTTIVFLGDYIDRGPESAGVMDFLINYAPVGIETVFLKGNHEDIFLSILDGDADLLKSWFRYGGRACARSYGIDNLGDIDFAPDNVYHQLLAKIPKPHIEFLQQCRTHFVFGDYICVHAGLRPSVPIKDQSEKDMMWIREDFVSYKGSFPLKVVHGHTVVEEASNHKYRIAVDTGAYQADGALTAACISREQVEFVSVPSQQEL